MRKFDLALLIGLILAVAVTNFASFNKNYDDLQNGVLRMHILANSDSDDDQKLKLKVRDRLLECSEEIFGKGKSLNEAEENVQGKIQRIKEIANEVIKENGYSYNVECSLVNMEFDERKYGGITMPAGKYDAVRVTIGKAQGHNWWCVMYPPLCIPAAEEVRDKSKTEDEYFSDGELDIMKNPQKYKMKFKCVEVFKEIKSKLS